MSPRPSVAAQVGEIVDLLRSKVDIPVHVVAKERGPYLPGVNVVRMVRKGAPSTSNPYHGTRVVVMYEPQTESEKQHEAWSQQVREVLLEAYPDRFRRLSFTAYENRSETLIEDVDTAYTAWRTEENAKRARLGWAPLHEIGK